MADRQSGLFSFGFKTTRAEPAGSQAGSSDRRLEHSVTAPDSLPSLKNSQTLSEPGEQPRQFSAEQASEQQDISLDDDGATGSIHPVEKGQVCMMLQIVLEKCL